MPADVQGNPLTQSPNMMRPQSIPLQNVMQTVASQVILVFQEHVTEQRLATQHMTTLICGIGVSYTHLSASKLLPLLFHCFPACEGFDQHIMTDS